MMKCQYCGAEIDNEATLCTYCGQILNNKIIKKADMGKSNAVFESGSVKAGSTNNFGRADKDNTVPWYFRMWFISVVFWGGSFIFGLGPIVAIVLFIFRMIKYPNNRRTALLSAGIQVLLTVAIITWLIWDSGKNDRAINNLLNEGKYTEAIEYVEANYDSTTYGYYTKIAEIYEKQGDYDSAVSSILRYTEIVPDITDINDSVISKLKTYKGKISDEKETDIDRRIEEINAAKAEKEAAEKKAAEEKAAKEAAEKEAAEKKAAEEKAAKEAAKKEAAEKKAAEKEAAEKKAAEEKAAKETAKKEAAEKKAAEEKAAKEAAEKEAAEKKAAEEKAAADAAAAEQKAKEDEAKNIEQNAQILGVDLVMESHSSSYEDKYFKTEGTIEEIDGTDAYLIRYLSTVRNHKRMYKTWILSNNTSGLYVGENVYVIAKYVGFAEESSVPTLEEYKIDKNSNSFYSVLSSKAKIVNYDVSFEDLLRYGEYQEYVYVEGTVTNVYDSCINIKDEYDNYYVVFDDRVNKNVVLQGDYVSIYGQFEGIDKKGYVWPEISWLVDAGQ